jgi:sulfatase modifying factor 1
MRYVSGPYTSRQLLDNIRAVEDWINNEFAARGPITDRPVQADMSKRVLDASFGRNDCIFDDQGNPSIMVRVPAQLLSQLQSGWADDLHPAFLVNGAAKSEVWVAKYQAFTTGSGATERAISLRRRDPRASVTFDQARAACTQKGTGWHLMTNAEWAYIALWCKANGYQPRGNNSFGKDHSRTAEKGEVSYLSFGSTKGRVATGTGPVAWSHDGSPYGIWDLNGNVNEWVGGMRINDGEIQIMVNNNAADNSKDQSAESVEWKAILQDGSLVDPSTADTLKYDATNEDGSGSVLLNTVVVNQSDGTKDANNTFQTTVAAGGVSVPQLLKQLALYPIDADHGGDRHYVRNVGERLPIRGGFWGHSSNAGVFCLDLINSRSYSLYNTGFRPAYIR